MPVPILDIVAVAAIQSDLVKQLASLYGVDYSNSGGKAFVAGLTGGTFARVGASAVKLVPGIGTLVGGMSMSVMSGASTYAVGQVAQHYVAAGTNLPNVDLNEAKERYKEEFEQGKQVASDLEEHKKASNETYQVAMDTIGNLEKLRDDGLVSEAEFEVLKQKLLERL